MRPDETWEGYRKRTAQSLRKSWWKMGLPLLTEKIAYEGDVPIMWSLRSVLGWRTTAWWRSRASWSMAWDPTNVTHGKHDVGSHNRGTQWDSPMARRAGEGNDWMKLVAQQHSQKEDVIHSLFASMRQAVEKKTKANETRPAKKPRELRPL